MYRYKERDFVIVNQGLEKFQMRYKDILPLK